MLATESTPTTGQKYLPAPETAPNQAILPLTAQVNGLDHLTLGGCDVVELVNTYGSPLYILDEQTLRTACQQYRDGFRRYYGGESQVIYASKAWSCLAVCAIVASEGLGFDVVSGGELQTTLQAGVTSDRIYFHGNNKSVAELRFGVEQGCTIIVDNWLELEHLAELATPAHPAQIFLRLTPGIECHTHEYIRTGHIDSKFGFDPTQLPEVFAWIGDRPQLRCTGLHAHIGSQIFERQPHQDLGGVLVDWMVQAIAAGLPIDTLNIGGGLGICYTESDDPPTIDEWVQAAANAVQTACEARNLPLPRLICEPGRSLIANACATAYTVGSCKTVPGIRTYIAVDGGMSDNPRPITYQSLYRIVLANRMSAAATETVTVAGKHCESGDVVIHDAQLPPTAAGDVVVVPSTGAYNYSMASNYNRIGRPAAVVVNQGEAEVILERETYEDLIRCDRLPARLNP
ncbi:diaminopimelate decarboxylase [Spirulina major CS-329]|uniref:diaminopimelate decarboxylase n=1 Tax=Spirulina TaxID=1154 RepID=UPI00232F1EC5|nr:MULTISPECIES: diaminopimelate decarboxylase [Spirulina]MDB9496926.1 diaminopimelate decarboxylase [Spirulina subsalsa CS-330]MDB9501757.1 diaminopimelate decarboxylase [Spirulina major CS-329]